MNPLPETIETIADAIALKLRIDTPTAHTLTTRVLDQLGYPTDDPDTVIPTDLAQRIIDAAQLVTTPDDDPPHHTPMTQGTDDERGGCGGRHR